MILKKLKLEHIIYQRTYSTMILLSSMEKNIYDQEIDINIKQFEGIGQLKSKQDEDQQQETIKNYQDFLVKDLKDQFI